MKEETNPKSNPLLCDPQTGFCESKEDSLNATTKLNQEVQIKIVYFTDPICSACWAIEPQLRKLKLEYGNAIDIEYRMGGLLKDWSYNSGGISKPSDVAHHWDEMSSHYKMPIDGDVWLENPLPSSFPPSIAFKSAELQDKEKAIQFLRLLREAVFLKKVNIANWKAISSIAFEAQLDTTQLKVDYENKGKELFQQDLVVSRQSNVRGFPTLFITDSIGNQAVVYGAKPYSQFESSIQRILPGIEKNNYQKDWKSMFSKFNSLTLREFSELTEKSIKESQSLLNELTQKKVISEFKTKNGSIWYIND